MAKVIAGMTMSLDGYINDKEGSPSRLYEDMQELLESSMMKEAIKNTGAVVMGRKAFEMADDPDLYAENYEFQVPIFVLCSTPPKQHPKENEQLTFTFVTEGIEKAVAGAKEAAGEKEVLVLAGAETVQSCIKAGLADELEIDVMPVLLNGKKRLFENLGDTPIELHKLQVREVGERTSIRYRVVKK
jgi:dihydrofolate reductase